MLICLYSRSLLRLNKQPAARNEFHGKPRRFHATVALATGME
jgi:hypothetical protein